MNKLKQHLQDKIYHETKVYERNLNDPEIAEYSDYEKGCYVGLIQGLQHTLDYIQFLKSGK